MPLTKIQPQNIQDYAIGTTKLSNTATVAFTQTLAPKITSVNVANSSYTILDDTAVDTAGGYIVINGSEFQSGATVFIDTTQATAVSYVNSTTLRAQVPARSAASYNLYVINPDGGFGIRVNGVTYSTSPTWVTGSTLSNQSANVSFNVSLSATGATTYSNTTALPAGTQLLSNGYFYGTVTIGAETTYSFTVRASDAELQDTDRTFNVTVTVAPQYQLWTWGSNGSVGKLGISKNDGFRSSPVQVAGNDWSEINTFDYQSGSIKTDGTLWTWGNNSFGNLGLNDMINRSSPVQVGTGTNWSKISIDNAMFAIKTNGTLWSWGDNNYGQLGLGDQINKSSPTQVGSATNWNIIKERYGDAIAQKTDGTLWTWGSNLRGNLGLNQTTARSSPTQIGSSTDWNLVDIGYRSSGATKTNGTLWTWGVNTNGSLGLGNAIDRSSPVQVGTSTNWNLVSVGVYSPAATKTDGTLWQWGRNNAGQLGFNDIVNRSSPVQVGTGTDWNKISSGLYFTLATKNNNTLWAWGSNSGGELGLNDRTPRSSPVQLDSSKWISINAGYQNTMAIKQA